jgi:dTDP-4-dehydrorhamnose 3,5-epimerase
MTFKKTQIAGAFIVDTEPKSDHRGKLARTYCKAEFATIGFQSEFVQMNHTVTYAAGTIRGMHFQTSPHTEQKLIRCIRGKVFDVAVDLRKNSKTFLEWISVELSDTNGVMLLIPEGCAHGFQALEDNSELLYCHTGYYTPEVEGGLRADDPKIAIHWPLPIIDRSDRDKSFPLLEADFKGISI